MVEGAAKYEDYVTTSAMFSGLSLLLLLAALASGPADQAHRSSSPNDFAIRVAPDGCNGCVEVDGDRFTSVEKLTLKVLEIHRRNLHPTYFIVVRNSQGFEAIGRGILLLVQSGAIKKIGFITEPREVGGTEAPNSKAH